MANIKVSEMTEATSFDDGDYTMIVQANQNKKISKENIFSNLENEISTNASDISTINTNIGDLTNLETDNKSNIVNSINELKEREIYSNNEVKTNKIWIDGKPIYRKTVTVTLVSGSTTINIYSGMNYVYFYGSIISGIARLPLNYSNSNAPIFTFADENKITINQTNFAGGTAYIVVEYTKSTD